VGQFYLDELTGQYYGCIAVEGDLYVWKYIGGSDVLNPQIIVLTREGATVAATMENADGTITISAIADNNGANLVVPRFGAWTITGTITLDGKEFTARPITVTVDAAKIYTERLIFGSYIFGYDIESNDPNPANRVTYPEGVDNTGFVSAYMDFASDTFNPGGWDLTPGNGFVPQPCMLNYDGTVAYYLDPNDYTKKEDGTASDVADANFSGNAMVEWPKIYTHREEVDGVYHFRVSDFPQTTAWECWCNYDKNNNEIDHFYTPIYFGSNVSSKLRSISGRTNLVSVTANTEITYAKANGDDWYTEVLSDCLLIQDLLVMIAKTTAIQEAIGHGRSASTNSAAIAQGTLNTKGMFWGSNDRTSGVKVFGMENWWGNVWRRIAGWINDKGTQKVKLTRGTKDGSTVAEYNTAGSGYLIVAGATLTGTSGGYISAMKSEAYGRIPVAASGSSSTYEADGLWFNVTQSNYAFVGGQWQSALLAGPFCALLTYAPSSANTALGAALSCKPTKPEVE
jgi:hypothetical protein